MFSAASSTPLLFVGANGFPATSYAPALQRMLDTLGRAPKVDAYDTNSSSPSSSTMTALNYVSLPNTHTNHNPRRRTLVSPY